MSSKFDEYLSKGGVTEQDKAQMAEVSKSMESVESTPTAPTPVPDNTKADSTPGKLDSAIAGRIESTQQGLGNNYENTAKTDSLSAYDNSKQSQQPSPLQKENESEFDR